MERERKEGKGRERKEGKERERKERKGRDRVDTRERKVVTGENRGKNTPIQVQYGQPVINITANTANYG